MEILKGVVRPPIGAPLSLVLIGTIGLSHAASANTIHVCGTCAHQTIQSAVSDAATGDSILLAAGAYTENVTIAGKGLKITGDTDGTGAKVTVFGAGRGPVFTLGDAISGGTTYTIEINNLTVSGGNHANGSGQGGGIQVRPGAQLQLINSTVAHNTATSGGGVSFNNPAATGNAISGCTIENNLATGNTEASSGGGVNILSGAVSIYNSTISRNTAIDGGGIYAAPGAGLTLSASTISNNKVFAVSLGVPEGGGQAQFAGALGGGAYIASVFSLSDDVITDNNTTARDSRGGGIYIDATTATPTSPAVKNTLIARNSAATGAGLAIYGSVNKSFTLTNDYIVQNTTGGVFTIPPVVLSNTTIKDNAQYDCLSSGCPNQ